MVSPLDSETWWTGQRLISSNGKTKGIVFFQAFFFYKKNKEKKKSRAFSRFSFDNFLIFVIFWDLFLKTLMGFKDFLDQKKVS